MRRCILVFFLLLFSIRSAAQNVQWGHRISAGNAGRGYEVGVAPNGNIYTAGYFTGTTDLDPTAGVYNITSNGLEDIYLACYTPAGNILWGFNVGGSGGNDAIYKLAFDSQSNVFVVGYFQGRNI